MKSAMFLCPGDAFAVNCPAVRDNLAARHNLCVTLQIAAETQLQRQETQTGAVVNTAQPSRSVLC